MNKLVTNFHRAAELVGNWGKSSLPDGNTVANVLNIKGISFWDVISPSFAIEQVTKVLSQPNIRQAPFVCCKTIEDKAKLIFFETFAQFAGNKKGCRVWPNLPTFLFLGFSKYMYRDILDPVANRISNRPNCSVIVLDDLLPIPERYNNIHGNAQSLWQHRCSDVIKMEYEMRTAYKKAISRLMESNGLPFIVESTGVRWEDIKHSFKWLFYMHLPRLISQSAIILHIIKRHPPVLIISPDVNDPRTRMFCFAGKLANIKTLDVQFGLYDMNAIEWKFFISDHIAVTGNNNAQVIIDHGVPIGKTTVTGSPRYDNILNVADENAKIIRQELGVIGCNKMLLFASQPYYYGAFSSAEVRKKMIYDLFNAVDKQSGLSVVVKPHPNEDKKELLKLAQGKSNIFVVDKLINIRELIRVADVFATFFSTTTFDALAMNKPTINIAYPGSYTNDVFVNCGATFVAKSYEDILCIVKSVIDDSIIDKNNDLMPIRFDLLQKWFYKIDGRAAERIEAIALQMAAFHVS